MHALPAQLEVEPMDLGADVRAVGLELFAPESHEPIRGPDATRTWARVLPAVAGTEPWALDFFSHLDRIREYCHRHAIAYRQAAARCIVIHLPEEEPLTKLLERFEGETFGIRAGGVLVAGDPGLEADLARRGADAYHQAFARYLFCGICDFENGFLTLLSSSLWATEITRRIRPVLAGLGISIARPH